MKHGMIVIGACIALSSASGARAQTPLDQTRNRANNPLPTAPEKSLEEYTYSDLMEVGSSRRQRVLHLISPDRQHALVAAHLTRMLEVHERDLSAEQERFLRTTLEELSPRDFVRRQGIDQASLMRAWRGDRLGRMYRDTDLEAFRSLFEGELADEIFRLQ